MRPKLISIKKRLESINIDGINVFIRPMTTDLRIAIEVIRDDYYRLKSTQEPTIIVDVGAHIGTFTLLCKQIWPSCGIIACEPFAPNFDLLKKNCGHLGGVMFLNKAIVGSERTYYYHTNRCHKDLSALLPNLGAGFVSQHGDNAVESSTLSNLGISINLLKMDCEGAEIEILRSSESWIGQIRTIIGEYHDNNWKDIVAILKPTHACEIVNHGNTGYFFANAY